jgi:hypothetical protein
VRGVSYALDNAMFQWQQGERRVREADGSESAQLERATAEVVDELRKRLGSSFELAELVALYANGTDEIEQVAARARAGSSGSAVVDAAFGRYAREAADFAGGRMRQRAKAEGS